jgi:hypothetical protein
VCSGAYADAPRWAMSVGLVYVGTTCLAPKNATPGTASSTPATQRMNVSPAPVREFRTVLLTSNEDAYAFIIGRSEPEVPAAVKRMAVSFECRLPRLVQFVSWQTKIIAAVEDSEWLR